MNLLLSGTILGSLLTIAFFLGGIKVNKHYDEYVEKAKNLIDSFKSEEKTTFSEPVSFNEKFTSANSITEVLDK